MKLNVRLAHAPDGDIRVTPPELKAMSQTVATKLTELLQLHGIKTIDARSTQIGSRTVLRKEYVPLPVDPPGAYLKIRDEAAATLANYMSLFGIAAIETRPDENDIRAIAETWAQIEASAANAKNDEAAKAPPTTDPQVTPVTLKPMERI